MIEKLNSQRIRLAERNNRFEKLTWSKWIERPAPKPFKNYISGYFEVQPNARPKEVYILTEFELERFEKLNQLRKSDRNKTTNKFKNTNYQAQMIWKVEPA